MNGLCRLAVLPLLLGASVCAAAQTSANAALLDALQTVRPDPLRTYKVADLLLGRDAVRLHLQHGTLVFLEPVEGRVTGAFFEGTGEVLVVPPERGERQQLLKFTGSPILTESFARAYFRFSDSSFDELQAQIRSGAGRPVNAPELLGRWEPQMLALNRAHAVRLLLDFLETPTPYFYAAIQGQRLGQFDIVADDRRPEQLLVGQMRWRQGRRYYDVWCSFAKREAAPPAAPVRVVTYRIDTTLTPERELEVVCEVELELPRPGPRTLLFELSRFLSVSGVEELTGAEGDASPLEFFQNATLSTEEARYRGTDVVLVVLPDPAAAGAAASEPDKRTLRFRYRGQVISDVGNGVLYVGARGSWYPRIGISPAHYELRFRTSRLLELVATGTLRSTREEGDWKETLWVTEVPVPVAGFNVGNYESRQVSLGAVLVTAYANRQLEPQLAQAGRAPSSRPPSLPPPRQAWAGPRPEPLSVPVPPAQPAELLDQVASDVANALATFSDLFGPFPYPALRVSQIPGAFGQGYPGLLYLSTFSFLADSDQARMGLSERSRQLFSRLTPAHETAHQWWGNWVRVPHYRDQWLAEGLAGYSALLYLEQQPGGQEAVREWLDRYRRDLEETDEEGVPVEAAGALTLGWRLDSSRSPTGYVRLIYSKAPWVLHMLRELLRDPQTGSDDVFLGVLRRLSRAGQPLSTAEFQRELEAVLPPHADVERTGQLDWFFQQWVYDTGVPRYRLQWQLRGSQRAGWRVEGTIEQSGVSPLFTMPVPVYAQFGRSLTRLGTVVVTDDKVDFLFPVKSRPSDIRLDPLHTVLYQPE